ncbi:hypothetical protein [Streptomyces sp. MS2.AVA.5]|uniref:Uncharacterized protein n=1 Tax=Streptomyces achmelvichensis TaxID=3134111 RepID=A0ACC6PKK2_9ACTN
MPTVEITRIHCFRTTSGLGDDDMRLYVGATEVFDKQMGDDDTTTPNVTETFTDKVKVSVYERDEVSQSDLIGSFYATKHEAGDGVLTEVMTGDGSHYDLSYEVT